MLRFENAHLRIKCSSLDYGRPRQRSEFSAMADTSGDSSSFIELTANIVSAYVSNNTVPSADVPSLISQGHAALKRVSGGQAAAPAEPLKPAVPIKRSVTPEYIVC